MTALPAFDPDMWAAAHSSVDLDGVEVALMSGRSRITDSGSDGTTLRMEPFGGNEIIVRISLPLGDATGYWHPAAGWNRHLPPDWSAPHRTSLASSAPMGCLYDSTGRAMVAFGLDWTVAETVLRFGVSEERRRFTVWLSLSPIGRGHVDLRFAKPGDTVARTLGHLRAWYRSRPHLLPLAVPAHGQSPTYSTWYAFGQEVYQAGVEREAQLAARLGARLLLLDDGWQALGTGRGYSGCGDWIPDLDKFPDLVSHVGRVQQLGMSYGLWIAPLLLGHRSAAFDDWMGYALHHAPNLDCRILDPRHAVVREHVVRTCVRLIETYGLDGLKVDFLNEAVTYAQAPTLGADIADVGSAMSVLLADLRDEVNRIRPDGVLLEFRQPYVGPAITAYGNLLRADDCPADAVANRVRTVDLRMTTVDALVHSDPILWDADACPRTVARQLQGAMFAVPQISVRLSEVPDEHLAVVEFWLCTWRVLRHVLLRGELSPGRPDELYPTIVATRGRECVVGCFADRVVPLDLTRTRAVTLINSTGLDRIVVDIVDSPGPVRRTACDAAGRPVTVQSGPLAAGLHSLPVPVSGLVTLDVEG